MSETGATQRGLPLPKWNLVVLAIPTFFMPIAYGVMAARIGWADIFAPGAENPAWMWPLGVAALGVTFVMWPVYLLWALLSKQLSVKEKALWALTIVLLNLLGMPMFYVFMVRRYLGLEGRPNRRDEQALDRLLAKCGLSRQGLNDEQTNVLRVYCRRRRQARWGVVVAAAVGVMTLYMGLVLLPSQMLTFGKTSMPTHLIVVDKQSGTIKDMDPDREQAGQWTGIMLITGGFAGAIAVFGYVALVQAPFILIGDWERRAFIRFLKATGTGTSPPGSK